MNEEDFKMYKEALRRSHDSREVDIWMLGDRSTILDVVLLLQYVRHAVMTGQPTDINVRIGHNVGGKKFDFTVNEELPDDMIPKNTIDIN